MWGTFVAWIVGAIIMFVACASSADFGLGNLAGFIFGLALIAFSYLARIARAAEATSEALIILGDPESEEPHAEVVVTRTDSLGSWVGKAMAATLGGTYSPRRKMKK